MRYYMIELRENEEKLLAQIQKISSENSVKDFIIVTNDICNESEIQQLIDLKLMILIGEMDLGSKWLVKLTEDGKQYFKDKEIIEKKTKKLNLKNRIVLAAKIIAYLITTVIAVAALIVAI